MRRPQDVSKAKVLPKGSSEGQASIHDATGGVDAIVNYAEGNIQEIVADDTAFSIVKGLWPGAGSESLLIYLKTSAQSTITAWTGWNFANTGAEPTGPENYGLYEILQVGEDFFIFVVEEG